MAKLHFKAGETLRRLEPEDMGLVYTSLQRLEINGSAQVDSGDEEVCLVVTGGSVEYTFGGSSGRAVLCDMLYLPAGSRLILRGEKACVIRYGAPCRRSTNFAHIAFSDVDADDRHKVYGKIQDGTRRDVWNYIDEKFDSGRFLVGICFGAAGGWTAWPPHEHGDKREEVYAYFNMGDGFGVQCVYSDMKNPDAVALVEDGDVIAIPGGYHPNAGCPKTGIRYIYCMVSLKEGDRNFMDLHTQSIYGDKLE